MAPLKLRLASLFLVVFGLAFFASSRAHAAVVDAFLQIPEAPGEPFTTSP